MKHLKTKLGLSVLALACLGAGVISLQPSFDAKAEETGEVVYVTDASGLVMTNGAMVRVAEDWSGIRWETTVKAGNYADGVVFGTLVAPTNKLGDDGKLTHDDESAMDLVATGFSASASEDKKFYSAINYDNLAQEAEITRDQAYALELTAQSYVLIDGVYYYADLTGINTSRSARQVAIAAELDGKLVDDQAGAFKYYGDAKYTDYTKNTGAVGTDVIDKSNLPTADKTLTVEIDLGTDEPKEVLIGGERITASYANKTLTISEAEYIPEGEYYITVFGKNDDIYTKPIISATKVIMDAEELSIFKSKGIFGESSTKATTTDWLKTYWRAEQEQSGYYVLGQDIDAEGYVHGTVLDENEDGVPDTDENGALKYNDSTWNGGINYKDKPIGLTGTFNGMGYAITDLEIGGIREGIFGIVNGGTVKNVAITDVKAEGKYKFVLANTLYKATVENVYIKTEAYEEGVSKGFPMKYCTAFANIASGNTQISSCLIHYATAYRVDTTAGNAHPTGIMFFEYGASFTAKEVYCVSDNLIGKYTHTLMYLGVLDEDESYTKNKKVWLAENEQTLKGTDGTIYNYVPDLTSTNEDGTPSTAPVNNVDTAVKAETISTEIQIRLHADKTRPRVVMNGAYRYNSLAILYKYNTTYTNLATTGCWYLNEQNELVWGQNPNA